jgi:hypothetical protein
LLNEIALTLHAVGFPFDLVEASIVSRAEPDANAFRLIDTMVDLRWDMAAVTIAAQTADSAFHVKAHRLVTGQNGSTQHS